MKTINSYATTVALAGAALLVASALAGCSSDTSSDRATETVTSQASPKSTPPSSPESTPEPESMGLCDAAFSPMYVTADDGTVKSQSSENIEAWAEADSLSDADVSLAFFTYYDAMKPSAPSSIQEDLDLVTTYYKDGGDWRNPTTEIFDATSAIGQTVADMCPVGDATD